MTVEDQAVLGPGGELGGLHHRLEVGVAGAPVDGIELLAPQRERGSQLAEGLDEAVGGALF